VAVASPIERNSVVVHVRDAQVLVLHDNFRMNTGYGRYGAAYNMVVLIKNFRVFE
jgi:hypothetical protein